MQKNQAAISKALAEIREEVRTREDKPWPPEEDCPGCDKHKDGPHRFGCTVHGKRSLKFTVNLRK